jgi:hypothetical protein
MNSGLMLYVAKRKTGATYYGAEEQGFGGMRFWTGDSGIYGY